MLQDFGFFIMAQPRGFFHGGVPSKLWVASLLSQMRSTMPMKRIEWLSRVRSMGSLLLGPVSKLKVCRSSLTLVTSDSSSQTRPTPSLIHTVVMSVITSLNLPIKTRSIGTRSLLPFHIDVDPVDRLII